MKSHLENDKHTTHTLNILESRFKVPVFGLCVCGCVGDIPPFSVLGGARIQEGSKPTSVCLCLHLCRQRWHAARGSRALSFLWWYEARSAQSVPVVARRNSRVPAASAPIKLKLFLFPHVLLTASLSLQSSSSLEHAHATSSLRIAPSKTKVVKH